MNFLPSLTIQLAFLFSAFAFCVPTFGQYEPTEESLSKHTAAPEWFQDAKLGIYFHWGVYSVPAFKTEHYVREMHKPDSDVGKHHKATYGDPSKFAYHDFIPKFTAEKFNAEEWAQLVADAGAKFSGPVTEHHDGFAMWDSELTPWNAADKGPNRDILGEYSEAIRAKGLKLITTFHIGRHLGKGHIPRVEGYPSSTKDPILKQLYYSDMTDEEIMNVWVAKVDEVINKYHPDVLWFDSWLHALDTQKRNEMLARFLNHANGRRQEVVISFKQEDLSKEIGVVDIEKGRMNDLQPLPWLTDDTITWGWGYTKDARTKPFKLVLHSFVDTVSKNGVVLLNMAPMSDGTIPDNQKALLKKLGKWLSTYGESIYATRPWVIYGTGPGDKAVEKNIHGGIKGAKYTALDLRFTKKGNLVFIHQMGQASAGTKQTIEAFDKATMSVKSVVLLNSDEKVKWSQTDNGLELIAPNNQPDDLVNVYKVTLAK